QSFKERIQKLEVIKEKLNTMLLEVKGIQDDRIIRSYLKMIDATLRTNYFISNRKLYDTTLSFKINSKMIDFAQEPKPFREIYVFDVDMEGIHLRGGKIARGGLRWSDRTDDFRTEVLGLVKTQMVKNAIIIPVGSKGGFIVKRTKANQEEDYRKLGIHCYRKFISGLLDITDNYGKDGSEIQPDEVVIYDEFDPYLVVAADKGTAAFSDIANEISSHYGFWLKDAFASGGSNGYNHKEMGITARGAWECAKRHFREKNIDIQKESITVVGIGDMSGDVFGNGMLLSKKIKLVGAFNHLHIFIDPTPENVDASHAERKRLFNKERSLWTDYSEKLLSKGGGIFDRNAKSIKLSSAIKKLVKTELDEVNGEELIKLLLKAPVDMIFNGGIGTYIKASIETDAEVDDKANDTVRVNAGEMRATSIVEGGNLGITQKGRIEFEKNNGTINTDAIDNSAGVDTSDHEVNLKILIESLKANKKIQSDSKGNRILRNAQDYVAERTLKHNFQQSAAISMDRIRLKKDSGDFFDLMRTLEEEKLLNRKEDDIPNDGDLEYQVQHSGMPRSVLSYILGLEKIRIYQLICDADIAKHPNFQKFLFEYFPDFFHKKGKEEILNHRLSANIVATILTNRIVNRGGVCFVHSLAFHSLAKVEDILETYYFVDEILDSEVFRRNVMELEGKIATDITYRMLINYERVIYKMVGWILKQGKSKFVDFNKVKNYKKRIQDYFNEYFFFLSEINPVSFQHVFDEIDYLKSNGVPKDLAQQSAYSIFLKPALGLLRISEETKFSIRMVGESNILIGERFHLNYLHTYLRTLPLKSEWDKACFNSLESELYAHQDRLVCYILSIPAGKTKTKNGKNITSEEMREQIVEKMLIFIEEKMELITELDKMAEKLKSAGSGNLTPIVVMEKFIAKLIT
ncbi:MAG: NAD-glutamate dehydrogenase, partial [Nitrospinae bacterium]|nr:NAD-glutamate dehydrogenase [Nitrospinota bacterium]